MKPLREAIEALKRELGAHIATGQVSATLHCVLGDANGEARWQVVTADDPPGLVSHALTVHFSTPAAVAEGAPPPAKAAAPPFAPSSARARPADDAQLVEMLTRIFGAPGFDNAARASVFREMLEELQPAQVTALLDNLRRDRTEVPLEKDPDAAVANARTRLLRLLKLGPAGQAEGIETVLQMFAQYPPAVVVHNLRVLWKTQSEWVNT